MDSSYARVSLSAYRRIAPEWVRLGEGDNVELHGPAYLEASELATTGIELEDGNWVPQGVAVPPIEFRGLSCPRFALKSLRPRPPPPGSLAPGRWAASALKVD